MAESAEQYRLNTYMYIKMTNVVKERRKKTCISTQLDDVVQAETTMSTRTHTPYAQTHTPYAHTNTHTCTHTITIQSIGVKDRVAQLKCSERRNVFILFLKKEKVVVRLQEIPMGSGYKNLSKNRAKLSLVFGPF